MDSSHDPAPLSEQVELVAELPAGEWLRQPQLEGIWLDVLCRCPTTYHNGIYDKRIGLVKGVPRMISAGHKGVVPVSLGPFTSEMVRKLRVEFLYPLGTTEMPGIISRSAARPVLEVDGMCVVVIGPCSSGDRRYIGRNGVVQKGAVLVNGYLVPIYFPPRNVCRSDPFPRI